MLLLLRVTNLQGEAQFLRQQLDGANNKLLEKDRAAQETQDKFTLMLNSLRSDAEKVCNRCLLIRSYFVVLRFAFCVGT